VRGGARIVQVLGKTPTPNGPEFPYLDIGPGQATTAPTITMSTSTSRPKHSILVTVGNLVDQAAFEVAESSSAPSTGSALWKYHRTVSSTAQFEVTSRPSGTHFYGRARNVPNKGIRSAWSVSSSSVQTGAISPPTNISTATPKTQFKQGLTWTVGDATYMTEVCCDENDGAVLASSNRFAVLPPSSIGQYTLQADFATGSTYLFGVRHRDIWGGVSAFDSTTFEPSTVAGTAPDMLGLAILWDDGYAL
jgi:hypothetical protein